MKIYHKGPLAHETDALIFSLTHFAELSCILNVTATW